jgi:imidazolonepropionase-like amidohydrolase
MVMAKRFLGFMMVVAMGAHLEGAAAVRQVMALKTKVLITGAGPEIPGAVCLIEDGIIAEIGPQDKVKIPWNADVIDAGDQFLMPGFVLAHTSEGLELSNESMPDVPFLSTFDAIDPFRPFFRHALRSGITCMLVLPGDYTRFGGTGTIVQPVGKTVEEMLIAKPYGLKISLDPAGGESRMGHMQKLREFLRREVEFRGERAQREKEAKEANRPFTEEIPVERRAMQDLLSGTLTAFISCPLASDAIRAIELVREFKLRAVLVLGNDTWRAAAQIGEAKIPVVLPPDIVFFEEDPVTGEVNQRVLPMLFKKANVPFAFQIDSSSYDARYPWQVAAEAVKYGLARHEAIAAATAVPAQILGLAGKTGTIAKGCRADLVLLTGDPLDPKSWVDKVLIGGKVVYDRANDDFLKGLLGDEKK